MAIQLAGFDQPGFTGQISQVTPIQAKAPAPTGNFLTHLLPSIGGIGGGVGGGALGGALAGSAVLPGVGTVAGGLLGALLGGAAGGAAGKVAENKVEGQGLGKGVAGQALEQGVLSAGPLRLLKGATAAGKVLLNPGVDQAASGLAGDLAGNAATQTGGKLANALNAGGAAATAPGAIQKTLGNVANKMYTQAFTVPSKLAGRLNPTGTAQELMQYGVKGGLDNIGNTSQGVMNALQGTLSKASNNIGGYIHTGSVEQVAKDALHGVPVGAAEKNALNDVVGNLGANGPIPGTIHPADALDKMQSLSRQGFNYINKGTNAMNPQPKLEALGNAYVQVANELGDKLYSAMDNAGTLKPLQTPAMQQQLNGLAKGLGDKFMAAKSGSDVRSLMAPFVRANQMVNLTKDASNSVGSQSLGLLGGRMSGAGAGFAVGHIPGAVAGFLGAPLLRGAEEAGRAPVSTAAGSLMNKVAGAADTSGQGLADVAKRSLPVGLVQALSGAQSNGLAPMTDNSSNNPTVPTNQPATLNASTNSSMPSLSQTQGDTSSSNSPFDPANIEANIQKIVANGGNMKDVQNYVSLATSINSLQQKAGASGAGGLTTNQKNEVVSQQKALDSLNAYTGQLQKAGGAEGPLLGALNGSALGNFTNPAAKGLDAQRIDIASAIAGALNPRGTVSPVTARIISDALPSIHDTPKVAQAKIANLVAQIKSGAFSASTPVNSIISNGQ